MFSSRRRTLGLFGVALLPLFGIVCFFYPNGTPNGAYSIIVGVVGSVVLWPVWHFKMLLYFTQIYWLMAVLYSCSLSLFCVFFPHLIIFLFSLSIFAQHGWL